MEEPVTLKYIGQAQVLCKKRNFIQWETCPVVVESLAFYVLHLQTEILTKLTSKDTILLKKTLVTFYKGALYHMLHFIWLITTKFSFPTKSMGTEFIPQRERRQRHLHPVIQAISWKWVVLMTFCPLSSVSFVIQSPVSLNPPLRKVLIIGWNCFFFSHKLLFPLKLTCLKNVSSNKKIL